MSLTIAAERRAQSSIWPYVQIARVDHWFKNAFMLLGVVLAMFYEPSLVSWSSLVPLAVASGGQVLVSGAAAELLSDELPEGVGLQELGTQQLKDLSRPERVYQVEAAFLATQAAREG